MRNIRYLIRHASAAGIMIVLSNTSYAGHLEHAWATVHKVGLGVMHITQDVRPCSQCMRSAPPVAAPVWPAGMRRPEAS
jgi:hypothetical protein